MTQSRRIVSSLKPQHSLNPGPKAVPWGTIVVLVLALILILALWGKIPRQTRRPPAAPPAISSITIDNSLQAGLFE